MSRLRSSRAGAIWNPPTWSNKARGLDCADGFIEDARMPTSHPRRDKALSLPQAAAPTTSSRLSTPALATTDAAESPASEVNVSPASAMKDDVASAHARHHRWLSENEAALNSSNEFVERNGLPLAKYRRF